MLYHQYSELISDPFFYAHEAFNNGVFSDNDNIEHKRCRKSSYYAFELLADLPCYLFSIDYHVMILTQAIHEENTS